MHPQSVEIDGLIKIPKENKFPARVNLKVANCFKRYRLSNQYYRNSINKYLKSGFSNRHANLILRSFYKAKSTVKWLRANGVIYF